MKELSIEEKAKAYDEAIEKFDVILNLDTVKESGTVFADDIRKIFPQLKESEDEGIRQFLINEVTETSDEIMSYRNMNKKDVLAWIEKQGRLMKALQISNSRIGELVEEKYHLEEKLKKQGGKIEPIEGFNTEFERQVSHIIASLINKEYEYTAGYVKWVADALLNYAKQEIKKQGEQKLIMIQWQGNNLKEVIAFTGKDKNFEKWFKSFEEYEQYVQMHNGIFKLFNEDGSHYEIPVGAWIVKTPDGYNVPSKAKYIQKSADKVEPKFKVGDWVVYNRNDYSREIIQVYDIRDGRYYFTDNVHFSWSVKECDEKAHLWTISDAKNGDVLFTSSTASHETFIFKSIDENGNAECYFAYDSEDGFREGKYHFIGSAIDCKPATKEQRELLFSKMHEAGYEWDAAKKELKKIEPKFKVGDWIVKNDGKDYFSDGSYVLQITDTTDTTNINGIMYKKYKLSNGCYLIEPFAYSYRLWTLQDAKDGDVLTCGEEKRPFIFKGLIDKSHPESPVTYCGIDTLDNFIIASGKSWWTDEEVYPATQEQRELLFQKMEEAGWEWDAYKKELKLLENRFD